MKKYVNWIITLCLITIIIVCITMIVIEIF